MFCLETEIRSPHDFAISGFYDNYVLFTLTGSLLKAWKKS